MTRVHPGRVYTFHRTGWDAFDPKNSPAIPDGTRVRVVKLPGCPPPNTMGHCHVADPDTGVFIGLVSVASLERV